MSNCIDHVLLARYQVSDPRVSDNERAAIDEHLSECTFCAAKYNLLLAAQEAMAERLYPDEALPELDCAGMARAIVVEEARRAEAQLAAARQRLLRKRAFRRVARLAAACLLLVAIPVLACAGPDLWRAMTGTSSGGSISELPLDVPLSASVDADPNSSVETTIGFSCPMGTETTLSALQSLDMAVAEQVLRTEVAASLPHRGAEYEAWARKEYPHVMALYDILVGRPPSLAVLPEDVRAALAQLEQRRPRWNGAPVNVPSWAEALYDGVAKADRPTGWQALLVYSGEIFKFDWPDSVDDRNVNVTLDGIKRAAVVAGYPVGEDAVQMTNTKMPAAYPALLADNACLARNVLRHIAISMDIVDTATTKALSASATDALLAFQNPPNTDCNRRATMELLTHFFDTRDDSLGRIRCLAN